MKKKICTRLLRFSAVALACAALLTGIPVSADFRRQDNVGASVTENQDGTSGKASSKEKGSKQSTPEEPGIEPQENWDKDIFNK